MDPQFTSAVRGLLMAIGSILVTRGIVKDDSLIEPIVGGLLSIGSLIWSQCYHYNNKQNTNEQEGK